MAASRALRVRTELPRWASRWPRKSSTCGAFRSSQPQRRRSLAGLLLGEGQQQTEGVTVGLDRAGAGAALGDQPAQEEVLYQHRERDLRRSHDAPAGSPVPKRSNRPTMTLISSGTRQVPVNVADLDMAGVGGQRRDLGVDVRSLA
jgi:hypothetical protein